MAALWPAFSVIATRSRGSWPLLIYIQLYDGRGDGSEQGC